MKLADNAPPDKTYNVDGAGEKLEKSGRQVLRYLDRGALRGSRASGTWTVTALQIWQFKGIADEMMANWREFCLLNSDSEKTQEIQSDSDSGE